jgi:cytochrome c oxidase cbb3-type subunit 2
VAQDYLGDYPVMLGVQRIGPDLANISVRKDPAWHLLHLYDPKLLVPGSMMPPYRYLFEKRRITAGHRPSSRALKLDNVPPGYEIVPTEDVDALVAYLLSLRAEVELPEAPVPRPPGAAAPAGTNAPAGGTNATNSAAAPASPTSAAPAVPTPVK